MSNQNGAFSKAVRERPITSRVQTPLHGRRRRAGRTRGGWANLGGPPWALPDVPGAGAGWSGGLPPTPAFGQGDLEHVIDGDDADQAALIVDHGDGDEVVVGHQDG